MDNREDSRSTDDIAITDERDREAVVRETETELDEDDRLRPEFVRDVIELAEAGEGEAARERIGRLHPADIADLFELARSDERPMLAAVLGNMLSADVLAEMNDYVREELIDLLAPEQVAELASELDTDDAVAIIEDMEADEQQAVLDAMEPEDRAAIEDALSFPEESAGRLMQRDLVAVPEHVTVGDVIDRLREDTALTSDFWEIFVVDPMHRPVGSCQLSWILRTPRDIAISDVMKREQTLIPIDMDQEEVALRFQKYALISAAVVDRAGRLVGMITVDDIVHIIQEEAGEDILRLSGAGDGDINEPIRETYSARVRWLVANLGTALLASSIVGFFGAAIEQMVALAVLMPIVAGVGGNAGTQTLAVTVRALAMNQLTDSNSWRAIWREMKIALLNGATIALLAGTATAFWFANPQLGAVIAAAMVVNIFVAGVAGVAIPLLLDRLDQDPAVASSIFVTMTTDSMGFLAFLGLAVASGLTTMA
ncbi:magnesium transporter [Sphingopyxis bauzanensis]|uniref:Magnesium transporter MgtE n=1 Tax=Sphingopyxis bauzanensis TaxID=651663 RepID=A0A246JVC6_9SPHN|nr:magnesium transporter [Sphingopyxis bauzanensis]MDP3783327.1 magnesium transporter [Sphingopyxis sp.]OWQ96876.1 magnesium transporter [Sphingopyxis bauzanensis]GGJ43389.1 magnesium transporter MgtE [Sphingopyxis bauzanensis]